MNYEVLEGFDKPHGKFPNTLGNVALIDCSSVAEKLREVLNNFAKDLGSLSPIYQILSSSLNLTSIIPDDFSFCPYALEIEGLMTKSVNYYVEDD